MSSEFDLKEHGVYYLFLVGLFQIGGGITLIIEHYLNWGYLEFEPLGHETYSLVAILLGLCEVFPYMRKRLQSP